MALDVFNLRTLDLFMFLIRANVIFELIMGSQAQSQRQRQRLRYPGNSLGNCSFIAEIIAISNLVY